MNTEEATKQEYNLGKLLKENKNHLNNLNMKSNNIIPLFCNRRAPFNFIGKFTIGAFGIMNDNERNRKD